MSNAADIQPFDLERIFLGDTPWLFTLEVICRTAFIYLYALLLIRWISRRAIGQLSLIEFLLVIGLGSAVGDPMFYHDVPLLHGMAVITVVVLLNRGITLLSNSSDKIEKVLEGKPILLMRNGLFHLEGLRQACLNQDEVYEKLRVTGIEHLGQVAWVFLEQNGEITVFRSREEVPGLRIVPPWDIEPWTEYRANSPEPRNGLLACIHCGFVQDHCGGGLSACPNCCGEIWADAVTHPES